MAQSAYNGVMGRIKAVYLHYPVLICLVIFTIADGINNYNSGVYADAHGLSGGEVGWFAPNGVLVLLVLVLTSISYAAYLFCRPKSK